MFYLMMTDRDSKHVEIFVVNVRYKVTLPEAVNFQAVLGSTLQNTAKMQQ